QESFVKHLSSPLILHFATHGYFLEDIPQRNARLVENWKVRSRHITAEEEPLIRSGLLLAGARQRRGNESEDGILSALELATLDLRGTELVVLSACDTGKGAIR